MDSSSPSISQAVVNNIGNGIIESYLRKNGMKKSEDFEGMDTKYWVDSVLSDKVLKIEDFERFLLDELFYGKRKNIRVFKMKNYRQYIYPEDWSEKMQTKYSIPSMSFSDVLRRLPSEKRELVVSAVEMKENDEGEIEHLQILFAQYIEVEETGKLVSDISYIPVDLDFDKKRIIIKMWNRQHIAYEDFKVNALFSKVLNLLEKDFNVKTEKYGQKHKRAIYLMSQNILSETYSRIEAYNNIDQTEDILKKFCQQIYNRLPLVNIINDGEKRTLPVEVMDFEEDIRNVIESLAICDFFYKEAYGALYNSELEAVLSRIRFNDEEQVLTSLTGENRETPIIYTKTFLALKRRMRESEKTEAVWLAVKRNKGRMNVKYDAQRPEYLEILITSYNVDYKFEDLEIIMERYEKYEKC